MGAQMPSTSLCFSLISSASASGLESNQDWPSYKASMICSFTFEPNFSLRPLLSPGPSEADRMECKYASKLFLASIAP